MKYIVNPILFSSCALCFGLSKAIYRSLPKGPTCLKYAKFGFGLAIPYTIVNEVSTGMLIRGYGREQYFYSNTIATAACFSALLALRLPSAAKRKFFHVLESILF
jgi:hypothetical protein